MKKTKKEEKIQSNASSNKGRKVWKIVAIMVVVVFAALIVGGIMKAHYIRASFVKPTQDQVDYATKIATEKLESTGENASAFQIKAGDMMRKQPDDTASRTIIQVSFYNNATTHTYLIDVNSGEVLMHSETEVYIALGNQRNMPSGDGFWGALRSPPRFSGHGNERDMGMKRK